MRPAEFVELTEPGFRVWSSGVEGKFLARAKQRVKAPVNVLAVRKNQDAR